MYTDVQVARMREEAPLDMAKCVELGGEFSVSYRSVIGKAKQMQIEYVAVKRGAKAAARDQGPTKAVIITNIRKMLEFPDREGDLTKMELEGILLAVIPDAEEGGDADTVEGPAV